MISNADKCFNILTTNLNASRNYFDSSIKIIFRSILNFLILQQNRILSVHFKVARLEKFLIKESNYCSKKHKVLPKFFGMKFLYSL